MKKNRMNLLHAAIPAAAAVLNALPGAVAVRIYPGGAGYVVRHYSGFSMTPLSYGHWSPMATGILLIALAVIGIVRLVRPGGNVENVFRGISAAAVVTAVLTTFGTEDTIIGTVVCVLTIANTLLSDFSRNRE